MTQASEDRERGGRRRLPVLAGNLHPRYVVWELTLLCDHACTHCGSRAGVAREHELSTREALAVVEELAALGAGEVVLIGGEAYLHPGFLEVVSALREASITPVMTTGGRGVDAALARRMAEAGMQRVGVSVDGLRETHDQMRARKGSFDDALRCIEVCREAGLKVTANTNLNRLNEADFEALYEVLRDAGARGWQVQLTAPLGRAADRPEMLLQPYDLPALFPRIAAIKQRGLREGMLLMPGNNLGYFGPEEGLLRSQRPSHNDHFGGCQAGRYVMGIESDGAVKGCPSLQTKSYVGGNVADGLAAVWNDAPKLAFARERTVEDLWGFCRECPYASTCLGGCTFTAHSFFGRPGNQPYCHYRALEHGRRGLRERLVPKDAADGQPFDHGLFDIVVEPAGAPEPARPERHTLVQLTRPHTRRGAPPS
ncbi:MAG: radical SAM protein [Sandaracinaceae bacterium]